MAIGNDEEVDDMGIKDWFKKKPEPVNAEGSNKVIELPELDRDALVRRNTSRCLNLTRLNCLRRS